MEILYFKLDKETVLAHARKNSIITVWYKNDSWEMSPSSAWILEKDKRLEEITEAEALSLCKGNSPKAVLEKILGILE